jgi:hypothetical protein
MDTETGGLRPEHADVRLSIEVAKRLLQEMKR